MQELMDAERVTYWGISEADEATLRRAHAVCPVTAVQNRYSMMARQYESLFPALEELGIGLVCFSPLGRGYLTGTLSQDTQFSSSDVRASMPRFRSPEALGANQAIVALVRQYAAEKGCTPASSPGLADGAKLGSSPFRAPPNSTGSRRPGCGPGLFLPEELSAVQAALDQIPIHGARYNDQPGALVER